MYEHFELPIPKFVGRFNRYVTNPLARLVAGWLPPFALIAHRGRVSGRDYLTPVVAFRTGGGLVVALTYGSDADWVRNVLEAKGCRVERIGATRDLADPRIVSGPDGMRLMPSITRIPLRLLRVTEFLLLSRNPTPSV